MAEAANLQSVRTQTHYGRDNSKYGGFGDQTCVCAAPLGGALLRRGRGGLQEARVQLHRGGCYQMAGLTGAALVLRGILVVRAGHVGVARVLGSQFCRFFMLKLASSPIEYSTRSS